MNNPNTESKKSRYIKVTSVYDSKIPTKEEQRLVDIKKEVESIRHSLTVVYIILFLDVIIRWLK